MAAKGKWSEGQVREVLAEIEKSNMRFTYARIPDAHGGFMQPAAADFQWFVKTPACGACKGTSRNGVIEVKEVEHLYRLDHKNFSSDKIARMWNRHLAGCEEMVLVAHKLKGMRKPDVTWRRVPLQFFRETTYVKGVGSWDLSPFPLVNMQQVLKEALS